MPTKEKIHIESLRAALIKNPTIEQEIQILASTICELINNVRNDDPIYDVLLKTTYAQLERMKNAN